MNQEIVNVIAAYLEESDWTWRLPHNYTKDKIAQEIAAKIEPLLPKVIGWEDAPDWANWRIIDDFGNISYSESFPSENTRMHVPKRFTTTKKIEKRPK